MKRLTLLFTLFITLSSHELFLKTDSHFLVPDTQSKLYLFNGTFDKSENIITRDRIVKTKVLGPSYEYLPTETDYYDKNEVTYLNLKTGSSGTYVAGISTLPRVIELDAEAFKSYLEHEELTEVIEAREKQGISNQAAREKYSKHVKSLLQVGNDRTKHYATSMDYPIEFIPLSNPYDLSVGDKMSFRLLYEGEPLPNQTVHYSFRTGQESDASERSTRTNKKGEITFEIDSKGQWYVATIHLIPSKEKDLDYESNWATLTFGVK